MKDFAKIPTNDVLHKIFEYREGSLFFKFDSEKSKAWNSSWSGKKAGSLRKDGYVIVRFCDNRFYIHRIIFSMFNNVDISHLDIDHIDGNHSNNDIANLRSITRCGNLQNQKRLSKNTTGCKNVHFDKKTNKFSVMVRANNKRYIGGYFSNIEDAKNKATQMRNELHKDFANHGSGSVLLTKDLK